MTKKKVRQIVASWVKQVEAQGETEEIGVEDVTAEQVKSPSFVDSVGGEITDSITADPAPTAGSDDELYEQARRLVVESQLGSTSMLQRNFELVLLAQED